MKGAWVAERRTYPVQLAQFLAAMGKSSALSEVVERCRERVGRVFVRRPAQASHRVLQTRREYRPTLPVEHHFRVSPAREGQDKVIEPMLE